MLPKYVFGLVTYLCIHARNDIGIFIYIYVYIIRICFHICTYAHVYKCVHPSIRPSIHIYILYIYIYCIYIYIVYIYICFGQEIHQHFRAHPITQICPSFFFEVFIFAEANQFLLKFVNFESWPLWGGCIFLSSIFKCVINHVFMSSRQNVPFETPVFLT